MSRLESVTRKKSSPEGKPRIYFCCHPLDKDIYLSEIVSDILSCQDCAIWYNAGQNEEYDENFFVDLKEMKLFVIPVTSRFLNEENNGLKEFRFAIENNIPVLPLMQEEGLAERFNSVCGELQYLYKRSDDPTAIGFKEKLQGYLDSILIGNDLIDKIRKSFDAYIFLSYRKKDRQYAQTLMRLIHENDFCRDIAIWYDEFLTPGENFNSAIRSALEKSNLFVLAVTPNLVNEINYVMTTEYPEAKKLEKPILPIELVRTSSEKLNESYGDLPPVVDAYGKDFSSALLDSISKIALSFHEKDAVHEFFIGLAYLGGIDVETDGRKAETLITSAAEKGLEAAMEKLADMYSLGNGVSRDYDKAINWLARLCEVLQKKYSESASEEALVHLASSAFKLGEALKEKKQSKDSEEMLKHTVSLCKKNTNNAELCFLMAGAYMHLGEMDENRRQEYYERKEKESKAIQSGGYTISVNDDGSDMRRKINSYKRSCFATAVKCFQHCYSLKKEDRAFNGLIGAYLSYTSVNVDDVALNSLNEEEKIYLGVKELCEKKGGYSYLLGDIYRHLGRLQLKDARMHGYNTSYCLKSAEYFSKAGRIYRELYGDSAILSEKRKLIRLYLDIATFCLDSREKYDATRDKYVLHGKWFDAALSFCMGAENEALELYKRTESPNDRLLIGESCFLSGLVLSASKEDADEKAKKKYLSAFECFYEQYKLNDTADVRLSLRDCCFELERVCIKLNEEAEAARFSEILGEISNYAITKTPFRNRGMQMVSDSILETPFCDNNEADPFVLFDF